MGPSVALAVLTLASATGLGRIFTEGSWLGPVVATAGAVHLTAWFTRRARWPVLPAIASTVAVAALMGIWTVIPAHTWYAVPDVATWHAIGQALHQAGTDFRTLVAPVPPTTGFKLVAVWGVGAVVVLGDLLAFRLQGALRGIAPAFALFVVCCAFGRDTNRGWAVTLELLAVVVFVLAYQLAWQRRSYLWFGDRDGRVTSNVVSVGAFTAIGALVVAALITPTLGRTEGIGVFGWKASTAGGGTRQVESPIVSLHTRLIQESNEPVFTVVTAAPSYYRLTTLDQFQGDVWQASNSYGSAGGRLPGVPSSLPAGTTQVTQRFQIQQLESIWLPLAFTPESVTGIGAVSYDPQSGSLLTSHATSDGETYTVTSLQYLDTLDAAKLAAAPRLPANHALDRYLRLPALPQSVTALAAQITAGQTTEYGKAEALQQFFHGPQFTYSLNAQDDGYGLAALTNFLFNTHSGYCQQFAGAYAVLARAAGLPTRLAVGFTSGTEAGPGRYQVTDADAHTWPEVNFPGIGWVPFEPTKSNFQIPGTAGYAGNTANGGTGGGSTPDSIAPKTRPATPGATVAPTTTVVAGPIGAQASSGPRHGGSSAGSVVLALAGGIVAAVAGLAALTALVRGWRWRRRRRRVGWSGWRASGRDPLGPPDLGAARILVLWDEAVEVMAEFGARQRPDETYPGFADRAGASLGGGAASDRRVISGGRFTSRAQAAGGAASDRGGVTGAVGGTGVGGTGVGFPAGDLGDLARLADAAAFSGPALLGLSVARAIAAGDLIQRSLSQRRGWRRRVRHALDIRSAWRPVVADGPPVVASGRSPAATDHPVVLVGHPGQA